MEIKKSVAKVQWSLINSSGISNPFDGTPFLCVGTIIYHCHQGNDVDVKTKQKRQERDQKRGNLNFLLSRNFKLQQMRQARINVLGERGAWGLP